MCICVCVYIHVMLLYRMPSPTQAWFLGNSNMTAPGFIWETQKTPTWVLLEWFTALSLPHYPGKIDGSIMFDLFFTLGFTTIQLLPHVCDRESPPDHRMANFSLVLLNTNIRNVTTGG